MNYFRFGKKVWVDWQRPGAGGILSLIFTLVIGLLLWSAFAFSQTRELVVKDQVLNNWGYKTTKTDRYPQDYCDPGLSKTVRTVYQGIKALKPLDVRGIGPTYFRFTLIKEIYENEGDAVRRFRIVKNPPRASIRYSKYCLLRKGFRVKNCIYIVHTDASLFYDRELPKILGRLQKYVSENQEI